MADKDHKDTTTDKDLGTSSDSKDTSVKTEDEQSKTSEEVSAENVAASTPSPGNPYTVSADGRGRAYDPAVDGAPGKDAEKKQKESDSASN